MQTGALYASPVKKISPPTRPELVERRSLVGNMIIAQMMANCSRVLVLRSIAVALNVTCGYLNVCSHGLHDCQGIFERQGRGY